MDDPKPRHDRTLRHGLQAVEKVLDSLDDQPVAQPAQEARRFVRQRYRQVAHVEFLKGSPPNLRYTVYTRNISQRGLGFLVGRFVYPNTPCVITLTDPSGQTHEITGRVVRCRYLSGTASLHEVGVYFEQDFDTTVLKEPSDTPGIQVRAVIEDAHTLVEVQQPLRELGQVHLVHLPGGKALLDTFASDPCDLILVDLSISDMDGLALIRQLREQGANQPIIALADKVGAVTRSACSQAGANACLQKPVGAAELQEMLGKLVRQPLVSSRQDQPELAELADAFVKGLHEQVRQLERAYNAGNRVIVSALAHVMRAQGEAYGFEPIAAAAAALEQVAEKAVELQYLREYLDELISACHAAQPLVAQQTSP